MAVWSDMYDSEGEICVGEQLYWVITWSSVLPLHLSRERYLLHVIKAKEEFVNFSEVWFRIFMCILKSPVIIISEGEETEKSSSD